MCPLVRYICDPLCLSIQKHIIKKIAMIGIIPVKLALNPLRLTEISDVIVTDKKLEAEKTSIGTVGSPLMILVRSLSH